MNRRKFLTSAAIAGSAAMAGKSTAAADGARTDSRFLDEKTGAHRFSTAPTGHSRPNIFLITTDMVSPDFYHPSRPQARMMHLPAMRSLMDEGVFFENAFATSPLCAPSRASYLTGRYSYVLGNGERAPDGLETELRPQDVIFPEYLKATGYVTKQCGKCHVGTKKFLDAFGENDSPWNRWSPPVYEDESYLEYQRGLGAKPQKYAKEIVLLQPDRKTHGNSLGGWIVQEDGNPFPLEAQYTPYLVDRASRKLEDAAASPVTRGRPVYLQLDIFDPHQPLSVPEGFSEREKELRAAIDLPATYRKVRAQDWQPFSDQPEIYDLYRRYWGLYDPQSLLDYRVAYALQMEVVDRALGRFIAELKRRDLYEESVIVLMADHGEMNGRWGLIDKGVYLYPDVLRVPLMVKMPSSWGIRPRTVEAPVSLLDVAPTLLSIVGIEPDARLDGHSLLSCLQGANSQPGGDFVFTGGWHVGTNFACGIQSRNQNGHYLYAYNTSSPIDELYDLNVVEAENLALRPEYAKLRREMIDRLGAILEKDPRWLGYWSQFRVSHFADLPAVSGDMQLNK